MSKVRLDQLLVLRGLAPSRAQALGVILSGEVYVGGARVEKAGSLVADDAPIEVRGAPHPYVSRGGVKLAAALDAFGLDVGHLVCLDLGASTGGFTDCLLQRGAAKVFAVDVGYGQLAHRLRFDPRVVVMERTNARTLTPAAIGLQVDLTVVDASFIGIGKLTSAIARCTREGGELVALIKPQFEVGREQASRGRGVVRDDASRLEAVARASQDIRAAGFEILMQCESALP
ncbi:MAG TPA: TlyA family RNA methyltransferase, partial [Polyangiaceae bacterium]|nr:TlyA family RNA methyltransferase [Polyangiaceae bacterium]